MTLETDSKALERARAFDSNFNKWDKSALESDLTTLLFNIQKDPEERGRLPHSIFFSYMRFNRDGTFHSTNWYHAGGEKPIRPQSDPSVEDNLGYWIRDMALHARAKELSKHQYTELKKGLEGANFPSRYSYCVYFMDDLNWKFLMDPETGPNSRPVVTFHEKKFKKTYAKHGHAFGPPALYESTMPNKETKIDDVRQSMVMINRMHNKNDKWLEKQEKEEFSFDLWMRVRYAGSTNGLTLIIDPGGENEGPPTAPPDLN